MRYTSDTQKNMHRYFFEEKDTIISETIMYLRQQYWK
jgi:hypothetical protein